MDGHAMRIRQVSGSRNRYGANAGSEAGSRPEDQSTNGNRMTPRHGSNKRIILGNLNRIVSGQRVVSGRGVRLGTPGRPTVEDESGDEDEDGDQDDSVVNIGFHQNKRQILSNFEEWLKLSNNNKINSKNSWNVSLIDYFYDMNVMKGQDGINFQVASATLDGCVKVYQSRVDSAVSETGKLLSGLSQKNVANSQLQADEEDDEDGEANVSGDQADGENAGEDGRKRRKINKVVESTVVDFETIRLKKFEQELAIDPLFKKALAEFDEGGAKSLLLNSLSIDASGRVVFDATMAQEDNESESEEQNDNDNENDNKEDEEMNDATKTTLKAFSMDKLAGFIYEPNSEGESLENMTICPTMEELQAVLEDISRAKLLIENVNNQIQTDNIAATSHEAIGTNDFPSFNDNDNFAPDFENDNYDMEMDDDNNDNNNNDDPIENLNKSIVQQIFNEEEQYTERSVPERVMDRDLMAYFDERLKSSWRGPENWRVTAFKNAVDTNNQSSKGGSGTSTTQVKTEDGKTVASVPEKKKATTIDFFSKEDDDELEDFIFAKAKKLGSITYDETQEMVLPEDIQFRSSKLTHLFTKPSVPIYTFRKVKKTFANFDTKDIEDENKITDENFFAEQYKNRDLLESFIQAEEEDFNNDFGGNDDFGGIDFNDAFEGDGAASSSRRHDGDGKDGNPFLESQERPGTLDSAASDSLSQYRRRRPEYVNFSRVAKRVDVKRLKDTIWDSIQRQAAAIQILDPVVEGEEEEGTEKQNEQEEANENNTENNTEKAESFRTIVHDVNKYYGSEERKDLSTSFHFICLLHLANEHGLSIAANSTHDDLRITGF